jgi:hypothetical protein
MRRIMIAAVSTFAVISFADAQQGGRQPSPSKPTTAEIQKVIQIISGSKAKTQQYCDLGKINQQMEQADQKNDTKALETLTKRADELEERIGPEFMKFVDALDQADDDSAEHKELIAAVETLDKLCPEK